MTAGNPFYALEVGRAMADGSDAGGGSPSPLPSGISWARGWRT